MCNNLTNLSALLTPFPLLLFRWFIDADVAGGLLADIDSRGPADGFQEPSNGCSPAFNFPQSLLSFLRDKSMSDVAAEYECSGCETHGADRLSRDEKKPCCDMLWPICGLGIPSFELTISAMTNLKIVLPLGNFPIKTNYEIRTNQFNISIDDCIYD